MIPNFRKKKKVNASPASPFFKIGAILFLAFCAMLVFNDVKIIQKRRQLEQQVKNYKKQIQDLEKKNEGLKQGISEQQNQEYIEKVAREELGMQKPGEKVVAFVMPQENQQQGQQEESVLSTKFWFGWLSQAWSWLIGKK